MKEKIYINYNNKISIKYKGITKYTNEEGIKYILNQDYGVLDNIKKRGNDLYIDFTNIIIVILNSRNIKRFYSNSYLSFYIDSLSKDLLKR